MSTRVVTLAGVALALASALPFVPGSAQGVGPGGPIGNSTGIGSGTGVTGTGPAYQNGTGQPTLAPPPPPGGSPVPRSSGSISPPSTLSSRPSSYPQPNAPFGSSLPHQPSTVALVLPVGQEADIAFMKGCWRSDVFQYEGQAGLTTWCFDARGAGKYMYVRRDQPDYVCHGSAEVTYAAGHLRLHETGASCSGGGEAPGDLACEEGSEGALCAGGVPAADKAASWSVRLYRIPQRKL
ncbi:MAG: hypothetical protein JOY81_01100 [Alphaproteobacteria bacterium]|nr:hypothetical protein [Alphaproteobacteria bacterium]